METEVMKKKISKTISVSVEDLVWLQQKKISATEVFEEGLKIIRSRMSEVE